MTTKRPVWLVTGLSGAGLSTTLKAMEDHGYEVVDNLRLSLLPELLKVSAPRPLALGIDSRTADFTPQSLLDIFVGLKNNESLDTRLLYLDATDDVLQRRFTETRRRHPLTLDRAVIDGINSERGIFRSLKDAADLVLDTSDLSVHGLRRLIEGHCTLSDRPALQISVTSFSFRHGLPREADLVFDVRFLRNPHWDTALRPLTGQDATVSAYVAKDHAYPPFWQNLTTMLKTLMPGYEAEGKRYLTVAFGCTGGRHRSVALAEGLSAWLREQGLNVHTVHRDMERRIA